MSSKRFGDGLNEYGQSRVGMWQLAWTGLSHVACLDTRRPGGSSAVICSTALSRRWNVTRRQILGLIAAATGLSVTRPEPSSAVCGEPDPNWAHYLSWKGTALLAGDGGQSCDAGLAPANKSGRWICLIWLGLCCFSCCLVLVRYCLLA
jgi:hypothetical protein